MEASASPRGASALREPLLHARHGHEDATAKAHTFTFANGVTRSVSRRDESIACTPEWILSEARKQLRIALPMVLVALLQYLLIVVSVMFVGHLSELELASAAIASSFAGVTGTSLLIGMASALDTLCGQAFGAKQLHMLGIYTQRAIFVLYVVCVPVALVWYHMDTLLLALHQDAAIAALAGVYARFLIPTLVATATLQPLVKFLQAQSLVLPMALFSAATLLLHVPLCYLLIFRLGIGYRGAAMATSISTWLNVVFIVLYIRLSPTCTATWTRFSAEAFHELPSFLKLAIPSAVMICLEYWSFEGLVLLSGLLPNPELETSTLSVCLTTLAMCYMVPYGIGAAVSTRVGNELGAGRPQAAKGVVTVALGVGAVEGVAMAVLLFSVRGQWGRAFSGEPEVVDYVASCIPLLVVMQIMDSIQGVLSGVARGCGWQAFGAAANLGAYYVVGLPSGIVLAFVYKLKGRGLWFGMILGLFAQTLTLFLMTCATDWQQEAEHALRRIYSSSSATLPVQATRDQKHDTPAPYLALRAGDADGDDH